MRGTCNHACVRNASRNASDVSCDVRFSLDLPFAIVFLDSKFDLRCIAPTSAT